MARCDKSTTQFEKKEKKLSLLHFLFTHLGHNKQWNNILF